MEQLIIIRNTKLFRDPQQKVVGDDTRPKSTKIVIGSILVLGKSRASRCLMNNTRLLGPAKWAGSITCTLVKEAPGSRAHAETLRR